MDSDRLGWDAVVRMARELFAMTQQQLAEAAGVSLKTIGNLESGGNVPQRATLEKIRQALGLSSDIEVARRQARGEVEGLAKILGHAAPTEPPKVVRVRSLESDVFDLLARVEQLEDRVTDLEAGMSDPGTTLRSVANEGDVEPEVDEHP